MNIWSTSWLTLLPTFVHHNSNNSFYYTLIHIETIYRIIYHIINLIWFIIEFAYEKYICWFVYSYDYGFLPKWLNPPFWFYIILKKDEVTQFKDYWPISCCSVVYKIILILLANRHKKIILKFITLSHKDFVSSRCA